MAAVQTQSLTGKVALVTGGSKGIGAGIVRRLASDGASVTFTYSSSREVALKLADEIQSEGGRALPLKADSASAEELRTAVLEAAQMLGPEVASFISYLASKEAGFITGASLTIDGGYVA